MYDKDVYEKCYYTIFLYEKGKWKETYHSNDWIYARDHVYDALRYKYIYKSIRMDRIVRCCLYDGTEKYSIYYHNLLCDGNKMKFKIEAVVPM